MPKTDFHSGRADLMGDFAILKIPGAGNEVSRERNLISPAIAPPLPPSNQFGAHTKQEVTRLSTNTQSAQESFKEVQKAIAKLSTAEPSGVQDRWVTISNRYRDVLQNCHDDASRSRSTIVDFLEIVVPYLLKHSDDRKVKMTHLETYKEQLLKGAKHSLELAHEFSAITKDVESFSHKWQSEALFEASRPLQAKLDELNMNMQFMTKEVDTVLINSLPTRGLEKRDADELRKTHQKYLQDAATVKKVESKVKKHAQNIETRTGALSNVWTSIRDDIVSISFHLELCCSDPFGPIFEKRLQVLQGQYTMMGLNFGAVEKATEETPASGHYVRRFWAKLFPKH